MSSSLPDSALAAWHAYLDMNQSKDRHFAYLEELEGKYKSGGSRSLAESARLERLLREHDGRVQEFRRLTKDLQLRDLQAHQALIQHITVLNTKPAPRGTSS